MTKNKNVIEEALLQISNLEESLNKNAEGILSSTMKEEISSLVKESLKEQDEVEDDEVDIEDTDVDTDVEDIDTDNLDVEDSEEEDMLGMDDTEDDFEMELDTDTDDDTIDLTGASDEEVLTVFKAMGDNDGVIVKKDDNMIHLSDTDNDTEYLIQLGESEMEHDELDELYSREVDDYDFHFPQEDEEEEFEDLDFSEFEDEDEDEFSDFDEEEEDIIFELEMDDDSDVEMMDLDDFEDEEDFEEFDESIFESKKGMKPKGIGMGNASKFKYDKKPNMGGGFKTVKKSANKTMGTGKAKFEYKEDVNSKGFDKKTTKKVETKEASRTLGNGKRWGRNGLDKPKAAPRHLRKESTEELEILRAKNEEYRKALDLFRNKLNEVAVFNSNLAYATRLFTEHSTTKQEKINILRRFDNVDTLKESKSLYKVIKDELGSPKSTENTITESFERTVSKTPSTGSAANLIESKTYENPQFLRMKDLMGKIK